MTVYRLLRAAARLALRWYYRRIEVVGADRLPLRGPALLAGNHPNALVDALVIGCVVRPPITLTAKATLLDHPITRALVRLVGIVPLRRAGDEAAPAPAAGKGDPARNALAFDAVLRVLERGGVVLIFPEGKSHSDPALAPLKTGLARMALMARDRHGMATLPIIPVGLTFERKWEPRSRVVVHVGDAIIAGDRLPNDVGGVGELTRRVAAGLEAVTLNFRTRDEAERTLAVSEVLAAVLDEIDGDIRPLGAPDPPLAATVRVVRRLSAAAERLSATAPRLIARVEGFLARLHDFERVARNEGVALNDITMDLRARAGAWFVVREATIAAIAGPLAAWGRINHWMPLRLARRLALRASRSPDDPAMRTIVTGLVLVLLFYALQSAFVVWLGGWWLALGYIVTLPLSATWDFAYTDRRRRALQRVRTYLRFRRDPALRRLLLAELAWLRAETAALDRLLSERVAPESEQMGESGGVPGAAPYVAS